MKIDYLNALAGSGKTHYFANRISDLANEGRNVLVAVPTTDLADLEYAEKLQKVHRLKIIHSNNCEGSVVKYINNHLIGPQLDGQALIITHTALERISTSFKRDQWDLFIDEIPQAHHYFEANMPKTHSEITRHVGLGEDYHGFSRLEIVDCSALLQLAAVIKDDDGYSQEFKGLVHRLISPHYRSYVKKAKFKELTSENGTCKKLCVNSVLQKSIFEGYHSVTMAGAHFDDSLLKHEFTRQKVYFSAMDTSSLRFNKHDGNTLTINYVTDAIYSKNLINSNKKNSILPRLAYFFEKTLDGNAFIYNCNKMTLSLYPHLPLSCMIPHAPHGLNNYSHIDHAVMLAARNPKPGQSSFLKAALSIDDLKIHNAIHKQVVYQGLMRSSLRDPYNENPKAIYVPDRNTADWLQGHFPGSELVTLDCGIPELSKEPRVSTAKSGGERAAKVREKRRQVKDLKPFTGPNVSSSVQINPGTTFTLNEENVTEFRGSLFRKLNSCYTCGVLIRSINDFENLLEDMSLNNIIKNKNNNILISPSLYDMNKCEKNKSLDNVVFTNGLFLDFDGGGFGPVDFETVFPNIRATIYSSFSSKVSDVRFRVWIPTLKVMNTTDYPTAMLAIEDRLAMNGFVKKSDLAPGFKLHGLDQTKRHAASMFFLPCTPAEPDSAYYSYFKCLRHDNQRVLDPEVLINDFISKMQREIQDLDRYDENEVKRKDEHYKNKGILMYMEQWCTRCREPNMGNYHFNKLAFCLSKAGCDEWELTDYLKEAAQLARHPKERLREIPALVRAMTSPYMLRKMHT